MSRVLVVIASKGYQDHELAGTLAGLAAKGIDYTLASTKAGVCEGKLGGKTEAELALSEVDPEAFSAVAYIGGPGSAALAKDSHALKLATRFLAEDKVVGAICLAPTILAAAGVLKGKKATVWTDDARTQAAFLESHGAHYTGAQVQVDGKVVTGNGPGAAKDFGATFAGMVQ